MKTPKLWKHLKRHPLSAEYRDISGPAWMRFCASLKKVGFIATFPIIIHEEMVLDGWQRLRGCIETNIEPTFKGLAEGVDPQEYVAAVNDERRHETAEEKRERVEARQKRVAEAKVAGESNRAIAAKEGVSEVTVRRDLKDSTASYDAVEPPDGKVTGRDGKKRDAKKPTPEPTAPKEEAKLKPGRAVIYNDKKLLDAYGVLTREVDNRSKVMGKGPMVDCKADRQGDAHSVLMHLQGEFIRVYKLWKGETA